MGHPGDLGNPLIKFNAYQNTIKYNIFQHFEATAIATASEGKALTLAVAVVMAGDTEHRF